MRRSEVTYNDLLAWIRVELQRDIGYKTNEEMTEFAICVLATIARNRHKSEYSKNFNELISEVTKLFKKY